VKALRTPDERFASLPGYLYSTGSDGVYVHLYDNSELNWHLQDGTPVKLRQQTQYPWSGDVRIAVTPTTATEFAVYVRIPGWSAKNTVKVNGGAIAGARPGEYLCIRRRWSANDTIDLSFDMTVQSLRANPAVNEDRGRVAFQRGPVIFCVEGVDQESAEAGTKLSDYMAHLEAPTSARFDTDLLGGVIVLDHAGAVVHPATDPGLYFPATETEPVRETGSALKLIPYYAWANRTPSVMEVWIPFTKS